MTTTTSNKPTHRVYAVTKRGDKSTDDFLVLDRVHRDEKLPDALKPRINGLLSAGVVERTGRGKIILSKKLYAFMGETGVHTRMQGLDRETEKELLLKHLRSVGTDGAPVAELLQVLKDRSRGHVRALLAELRATGRARNSGTTKAG
jgi:ATP-dependent DNA helicase RecG